MAEKAQRPWLLPFVLCSPVNGDWPVLSLGILIQAETSQEANRLLPEPFCPLSWSPVGRLAPPWPLESSTTQAQRPGWLPRVARRQEHTLRR